MKSPIFEAERAEMMRIVRAVSRLLDVPQDHILGWGRTPEVAEARQIAMFLCRDCGFTYPQVAEFFDRDHTTVLYAVRKVERDTNLSSMAKGALLHA